MTLGEIRDLLVSADPAVRHYFSMEPERDYTYWEETEQLPCTADDHHREAWRFYVHRYTRDEFDAIARQLWQTLDTDPRVATRHRMDFEHDTGYIHHIYECEGF